MNLTFTEFRTLLKLLSEQPDNGGWYDIKTVKEGKANRNVVSVHISRLKKKKELLVSRGNSFYKPTPECWKLLESLYNELGKPLAQIIEKRRA